MKSDQSDCNINELKPKEQSESDDKSIAGFNIVKEGIFLSNSDKYFVEIKRHWNNFCNLRYE